jgi:hypothetical protein
MTQFLNGALMMGMCVVMLFFLRSWRETKDALFLGFGLAFWILSVERVVIAFVPRTSEKGPQIFSIRLVAYFLILASIMWKNRRE